MNAQVFVWLLVGVSGAPAVAGPDDGLVAHWDFDEGKGDILHDRSGNGNDGKVHGAQWVRSGKGFALRFDGVDDYVNCGAEPSLDIRGPVTISVWVNPEAAPTREVGICGKSFTSYLLTQYLGPTCWWYIGEGGNNTSAGLGVGRWTLITAVFDGTTMRLYLNGEMVRQRVSTHKSVPGGGAFLIGGLRPIPDAKDMNYRHSGFFKGCIAELKVYARALAAEEIRGQYRKGSAERFTLPPADCRRLRAARQIRHGDLLVGVGDGGTLQIEKGDAFCIVQTTFSYPGQRIGQNAFAPGAPGCEPGWRPRVRITRRGSIAIEAGGAHYAINRTIRVRGRRVEVTDTVKNISGQPVGIAIRNQIVGPETMANPALGWGATNPTAFASQPGLDLGIVAEDAVARVQFTPFCGANRLGFRLDHFGLDAQATYTFRWAVYPLEPTGDRMAFVNRVRGDWKSNYTILGPAMFFNVAGNPLLDDPAGLKAYLRRRKLGVAMLSSPWLDYDPGRLDHVLTREEYKAMMQRAAKALKAADPQIKCVGCIEGPLVTIDPKQIPGGERLPSAGAGRIGYAWLDADQTKLIEQAALPWADSLRRDRAGRVRLELYLRGHKPQTALDVYAAPGNYHARFLLNQVKFLVEEVGLDGVYIDGYTLTGRHSYDRWDGHTVDMDPATGRITLKYTDVGLAGAPVRQAICEYLTSRRLVLVTNGYAATIEENAFPVMYFSETWSAFDADDLPKTGKPPLIPTLAASQLSSPIGLGVDGRKLEVPSAQMLMKGIILYLRHGMVYYHYYYPDIPESGPGSGQYGPINHMFPITPVRLFEGGIEGQQRTITCVSGTYEWKHEQEPKVLLFGLDGREKTHAIEPVKTETGWKVPVQLRDWQEIAIIEQ